MNTLSKSLALAAALIASLAPAKAADTEISDGVVSFIDTHYGCRKFDDAVEVSKLDQLAAVAFVRRERNTSSNIFGFHQSTIVMASTGVQTLKN